MDPSVGESFAIDSIAYSLPRPPAFPGANDAGSRRDYIYRKSPRFDGSASTLHDTL